MTAVPPAISPNEWIRIFASRFAQCRPHLCAEEVVRQAIDHFRQSPGVAPEVALALLVAREEADGSPPGR